METTKLDKNKLLSMNCNKFKSWISSDHPMLYLSLAFIIPTAIMYLLYIAMEIHPFGESSVLVLDLNGQYVYFYEALRNAVYGDTSLMYSFSRSLGGEFMGIYAYYIASPFSYIVCLFPQTKILDALLCIFLLKTGLCGYTFGFYLHKTGKSSSKIATVIFSCMYAMTSYAIVYQHNSMWIDAVIWLPIITYAIEQLVKYGRFKLYVIFFALTLMSNFYIGYMVCFYAAAYFIYYYFACDSAENNPLGEYNHFWKSFARFAFNSILAAGIAAIILLTAYYSLSFGKTTFSSADWDFGFKFDIIELLIKFLPGSYDTVRYTPAGLPLVYCGTLSLILVPVYFLSSKFSMKEKIMSGVMILFFVLSFSITVVDLVWHGFSPPMWLNYRYSFMLCFFLLVLACKAFSELQNTSSKIFFAICSYIAGFVVIIQALGYDTIVVNESKKLTWVDDLTTIWFSIACIGAYLIVLSLLKRTKFKSNMLIILAFLVCFELFGNGLVSMVRLDKDVIYSGYNGYNTFISSYRPILKTLEETDDSFYRAEKTVHRKTNDNMALNLRGLSNSTSTLNKDTIQFLKQLGYKSQSHNSKYVGGTPVGDSLLGIKYLISDDDLSHYYTEAIVDASGFTAWLNENALSIAYAVNDQICEIVANDYETPCDYMNAIITAMLGEDETVEVFVPIKIENSITNAYCVKSFIQGHNKYAKAGDDVEASIYYTFTSPTDSPIYFFIPSDYQRQVKLSGSGVEATSFWNDSKDTNCLVTLGTFEKGQKVELTITLASNDLYIKNGYDCLYYIDMDLLNKVMSQLKEHQYIITNYTERSFEGTIASDNDSLVIQTTIPYDEGWQVYVDGEKVEIFETLEALVAFRIDSGEHNVELKYMPKSFVLGLTITLTCIAIFVLAIIFEKKILIQKSTENTEVLSDTTETTEQEPKDTVKESDGDI